MTTFSCNEVCREALKTVECHTPATVSVGLKNEVPDSVCIHTNRGALLSILSELLDNANKFTTEGYINVGCRQTEENTMVFFVCNTGIGIPEDKRSRLFLPFAKLDSFSEGVGLGLTLCRNMARQLGGDLMLDETHHEDICFNITIPVS